MVRSLLMADDRDAAVDVPPMPLEALAGSALLDRRIREMRQLLHDMAPSSTATALKALREAFPDVPLDVRVRALKTRH